MFEQEYLQEYRMRYRKHIKALEMQDIKLCACLFIHSACNFSGKQGLAGEKQGQQLALLQVNVIFYLGLYYSTT